MHQVLLLYVNNAWLEKSETCKPGSYRVSECSCKQLGFSRELTYRGIGTGWF